MSDEDEDEFTSTDDPAVVPKAVAPQQKKTGIPGLHTANRTLAPVALAMVCTIAVIFFWTIGGSRHSESSPALANPPLLTNNADVPYHVPPAPPTPYDAYKMIARRAKRAGIATRVGNHSLRATGITDYLKHGGTLEHAQQMANHTSPRTTKLNDRRADEASLEEYEKIKI